MKLLELKRNKTVIILLILAGLLVYGNTLLNSMFWDDNDFVLNNQYVKDWQYFGKYFSENLIAGAGLLSNYWRPVLLFIFSLEYHIWGDWAPGFHFVNMAFHIADGILLYLILLKLFTPSSSPPISQSETRGETKVQWLAFLTSLVFLIHPLQTEAVSYVSSLGDSLSVFFMFAGILLYLKKYRFWPLIFYIFALMSKETAVIMPGLILLIELTLVFSKADKSARYVARPFMGILTRTWPLFAVAAIYIVLRATNLNFVNTFNLYNEENIFTESFYVRLLTFFRILGIYFSLLFWPWTLHMERSVEIATSFSWDVMLGAFLAFGLLILGFYSLKRWPAPPQGSGAGPVISFGIFWFFIALSPTSNIIVPINGLLYEHWMYLPLIGIFLIMVWLFSKFAMTPSLSPPHEGERKWGSQVLAGILVLYLSFFATRSIIRNNDWRDPIRFYNQTLKHAPTSYRVINNLGMEYARASRLEEAIETYHKAISLNAEAPVAYHNLGNAYRAQGKTELAISEFEKAIEQDPRFVYSYNALASIYLEQGNQQKAREVLELIKP